MAEGRGKGRECIVLGELYKMINRMILFFMALFLLSACTSFTSKQKPAPVYGENDSAKQTSGQNKYSQDDSGTTVNVVEDQVIIEQQDVTITPSTQPNAQRSSNVVVALLADADMSYQRGNLNDSVATIERALRIEPRNPLLLYKLALIRLQQGQPELAENLAKKSALLAEGNASLKKKNWLLIAEAYAQQNKQKEANEARKKAQQF